MKIDGKGWKWTGNNGKLIDPKMSKLQTVKHVKKQLKTGKIHENYQGFWQFELEKLLKMSENSGNNGEHFDSKLRECQFSIGNWLKSSKWTEIFGAIKAWKMNLQTGK